MDAVKIVFGALLCACLLLLLRQQYLKYRARKLEADARAVREADRLRYEFDQTMAADLRDRLSGVRVPHHEWPRQFNATRARLTANLPEPPDPNLHGPYEVVPYDRKITEDDMPIPIEEVR